VASLPRAHRVVADLPNLDRCGDVEELVRSSRPAASGSDERQALGRRAAELDALVAAARYDDAIALGAELWASAAELEDGRLHARIGKSYGSALAERDLDGGIEILGTSLEQALASAPEQETAQLAFSLAYVLDDEAKRSSEALWLARVGAGLVERMGSPPSLRAKAAEALGGVLRNLGRWEEAERLTRESLELRRATFGDDHPDVAVSRNNLGLLLYHLRRPEEGIEHLELALASWREHLGDEHPEIGKARNNLAMVLEQAGRLDEAEREYREALRIRSSAYGPENRQTVETRHNLAIVLWRQGKLELAHDEFVAVLRQWSQSLPPDHPKLSVGHNNLGLLLRDLERHDEAERAFRTAVEVGERAFGAEHPQMCQLWNNLAAVLIDRHADDEARLLLERSLALATAKLGTGHDSTKNAAEQLRRLDERGSR
jgi:tetratricopeptide (TPR) repeat protein